MKKQKSKYYILLLLAVMFAAPGITAYFLYQHPDWIGSSRINKGTLLTPPVALNVFDNQAKWRVVLLSNDACDTSCLQQLELLARVRLALGRKFYQVDEWLLLGDKATPLASEQSELLKKQDVHVAQLSEAEQSVLPRDNSVFIANPDGYLVLGYPSAINPDDIYKDLKLLLNTTETKNG